MYNELHKIDMIGRDQATGTRLGVQTDHRSAEEMGEETALSTLLAISRVVAPLRARAVDQLRMAYIHTPPPLVQEAIWACGGEIEVAGRILPAKIPQRSIAAIANEAFATLARETVGGGPITKQDLAELARRASELEDDFEDSNDAESNEQRYPFEYWQTVLRLCAVAGAYLAQESGGGKWVYVYDFDAQALPAEAFAGLTIPFVFESVDAGLVNLVNRAQRNVQEGVAFGILPSIASALERSEGVDLDQAPTVAVLKPHDWPGREHAAHEILLTVPGTPLVAFGKDTPQSVAYAKDDGSDPASRWAAVRAFLATVKPEIARTEEPFPILWVGGSYYATEMLFEPSFMRRMHEELASPLLLAGVPRRGQLLLVSGTGEGATSGSFQLIVANIYQGAGQEGICPDPLIIQDGKIVGLAKLNPPPHMAKKPFWKRWFGGN